MVLDTSDALSGTGVIVVALGSPAELSEESIRAFLREFLADPRVVDLPRVLWWPILHGPILRLRPAKTLAQYERIWGPEGSPLRVITEAQTKKLEALLPDCEVRYAYQYGSPNLVEVYQELATRCDSIIILSTYPQYAPATTGSVEDRVRRAVKAAQARGHRPALRVAKQWHTLPAYIDWHAEKIVEYVKENGPDCVLFSWHGLPDRKKHRAAQYRQQCHESAQKIMRKVQSLGVEVAWEETFQSKFGPGKWLTPATIDRMSTLPGDGHKHILVMNPGFFADCLETIEEMDVLNAETFRAAGGIRFHRISPPDAQAGAQILAELYSLIQQSPEN